MSFIEEEMSMAEVYCPDCAWEMEYIGGGNWKCPECGEILYTGYDEEGESTAESLSVEEAALIWRSHGKDEDYMFGYSEEELEDKL